MGWALAHAVEQVAHAGVRHAAARGLAGVALGFRQRAPAEHGHELVRGGSGLGRARRTRLAQAVS